MPESTAGMRESGVRMVRENAMDGFFNRLLDCRLLLNFKRLVEVLNDGGGFPLLRGRAGGTGRQT